MVTKHQEELERWDIISIGGVKHVVLDKRIPTPDLGEIDPSSRRWDELNPGPIFELISKEGKVSGLFFSDFEYLGNGLEKAMGFFIEIEDATEDFRLGRITQDIVEWTEYNAVYSQYRFFTTVLQFALALNEPDSEYTALGVKMARQHHRNNEMILQAANMILGLFRCMYSCPTMDNWVKFLSENSLVSNMLNDLGSNLDD